MSVALFLALAFPCVSAVLRPRHGAMPTPPQMKAIHTMKGSVISGRAGLRGAGRAMRCGVSEALRWRRRPKPTKTTMKAAPNTLTHHFPLAFASSF